MTTPALIIRIRSAIMAFLIGASIANFFYTKQQFDQSTEFALNGGLRTTIMDGAYMREAIIVTIAAIAWCLVWRQDAE